MIYGAKRQRENRGGLGPDVLPPFADYPPNPALTVKSIHNPGTTGLRFTLAAPVGL